MENYALEDFSMLVVPSVSSCRRDLPVKIAMLPQGKPFHEKGTENSDSRPCGRYAAVLFYALTISFLGKRKQKLQLERAVGLIVRSTGLVKLIRDVRREKTWPCATWQPDNGLRLVVGQSGIERENIC